MYLPDLFCGYLSCSRCSCGSYWCYDWLLLVALLVALLKLIFCWSGWSCGSIDFFLWVFMYPLNLCGSLALVPDVLVALLVVSSWSNFFLWLFGSFGWSVWWWSVPPWLIRNYSSYSGLLSTACEAIMDLVQWVWTLFSRLWLVFLLVVDALIDWHSFFYYSDNGVRTLLWTRCLMQYTRVSYRDARTYVRL